MMSCNSKMSARKKITVLAASSVASIGATYFAFTLHNPALTVVAPVLLAFVPCLVIRGIVGGIYVASSQIIKEQESIVL